MSKVTPAQQKAISVNNCLQRKLYLSHISNVGTRFEPVSPYPNYTKAQLDMRRKAEILQYKEQTYVLTKSQKWSNLVRAKYRQPCPDSQMKLVPTSSSNVPGPVILLYNNQNIPLYNYSPNINYDNQLPTVAYPQLNQPWDIHPVIDVICKHNVYTKVADLVLINPDAIYYNFTIKIPISISIDAIAYSPFLHTTTASFIQLNIFSAKLEVYYGNVLINVSPILVPNFTAISLYVNDTIGAFNASSYVGFLEINQLKLLTAKQYVYTFKLNLNISYIEYDSMSNEITTPSNINIIDVQSICNLKNVNDPYFNTTTNCMNINPPLPSSFVQASISGTAL